MKNILALVGLTLSVNAWASAEDNIQSVLKGLDPNIPIRTVEPIELPGFYAVELESGEVLYVDEQAEYILSGSLLQVSAEGRVVDLTEQRQRGFRVDQLATLADDQMIIYPSQTDTKARIYVFTDIDCPYCRKLHEEVPALTEMGVEVAYLAFPRSGPGTPTAQNMESIWCAGSDADQRAALDAAKLGGDYAQVSCDSPVIDQYVLGQRMGVTGTPAIVLEDGRILPGYMPAERIGQALGL